MFIEVNVMLEGDIFIPSKPRMSEKQIAFIRPIFNADIGNEMLTIQNVIGSLDTTILKKC